ncbi:hypothetical protein [Paenibacillus sp. GCM10012303]
MTRKKSNHKRLGGAKPGKLRRKRFVQAEEAAVPYAFPEIGGE